MTNLTTKEATEYEILKRESKTSFHTFVRCIEEIHRRRLYRDEYSSFEEFASGHLGVSRQYAYNLSNAGEIINRLSPISVGENVNNSLQNEVPKYLPKNETQVRELSKFPKEQQPQVWHELTQEIPEGQMTAGVIAARRREREQPSQAPTRRTTEDDYVIGVNPGVYIQAAMHDEIDLYCGAINGGYMEDVAEFFTAGTDDEWHGNIFVHPPFSDVHRWVMKAKNEYEAGNIESCILLVPESHLESDYYPEVSRKWPRAYLKKIPQFEGHSVPNRNPYMLLFLGSNQRLDWFEKELANIANVYFSA